MNLTSKVLLSLVLLAAVFVGGFFSGKSEKLITKDKLVYKDRIVTVTKIIHPDGTVEEVTKVEDRQGSQTKIISQPKLPRFSTGIIAQTRYDRYKVNYGVVSGMRIIDNVWLKASFVPADKQVALIAEYQF